MAKRYGHIRMEAQRAALDGIETMRQNQPMQGNGQLQRVGHKIGHNSKNADGSAKPISLTTQ
jgi:hypothetical protein